MENISTEQADRELICSLILFLGSHDDFMDCKIVDWRYLQYWLVDSPSLVYFYDSLPNKDNEKNYIPTQFGPDICGNCYTHFGQTLGARLRYGCIFCKESFCFAISSFYSLRDTCYISTAHTEYVFAWALYVWSTSRERQKGRYPYGKRLGFTETQVRLPIKDSQGETGTTTKPKRFDFTRRT